MVQGKNRGEEIGTKKTRGRPGAPLPGLKVRRSRPLLHQCFSGEAGIITARAVPNSGPQPKRLARVMARAFVASVAVPRQGRKPNQSGSFEQARESSVPDLGWVEILFDPDQRFARTKRGRSTILIPTVN
jgi:hypothetical protein